MAIYTGKDGSITFGNALQARVRAWTVEGSLALIDVTTLDKDAVQNEAGLKSFSGTATIMYQDDNTALQTLLDNIFTNADPVKSSVRFNWGPKRLSFNAFVTSATISTSIGEIITADVSFTAAGDLNLITL